MLSPEHRLRHVLRLVDEEKYFTIHAGRQTGKTTMLQWLVRHFNASEQYRAVWVDLETARDNPDVSSATIEIFAELDRAFERDLPELARPSAEERQELLQHVDSAILGYLRMVSERCGRPLVVLFDEADSLVGRTVVSLLTQLRRGYLDRYQKPFPHSVALVGQRQVRDYIFRDEDRRAVAWVGSTSPFNITAEAAPCACSPRTK